MSVFRRAARGADESAAGITGSDLESDSDLEAELTSLRNEGAPASGSGEETFGARIDAGALLSTDDDDDDGSSDGAETPVVVRQPSGGLGLGSCGSAPGSSASSADSDSSLMEDARDVLAQRGRRGATPSPPLQDAPRAAARSGALQPSAPEAAPEAEGRAGMSRVSRVGALADVQSRLAQAQSAAPSMSVSGAGAAPPLRTPATARGDAGDGGSGSSSSDSLQDELRKASGSARMRGKGVAASGASSAGASGVRKLLDEKADGFSSSSGSDGFTQSLRQISGGGGGGGGGGESPESSAFGSSPAGGSSAASSGEEEEPSPAISRADDGEELTFESLSGPALAADNAAAADLPLADGWEETDAGDGRTYFWNVDTDEVTWSRRRASVEVQESSRRSSGSASGPPRPPPSLVPQASSEAAGLAETSTVGPLPGRGGASVAARRAGSELPGALAGGGARSGGGRQARISREAPRVGASLWSVRRRGLVAARRPRSRAPRPLSRARWARDGSPAGRRRPPRRGCAGTARRRPPVGVRHPRGRGRRTGVRGDGPRSDLARRRRRAPACRRSVRAPPRPPPPTPPATSSSVR